jgi:hypothetical protein
MWILDHAPVRLYVCGMHKSLDMSRMAGAMALAVTGRQLSRIFEGLGVVPMAAPVSTIYMFF